MPNQIMSASQLGLNKPFKERSSKKVLKIILIVIGILAVILAALVAYRQYKIYLPTTTVQTNGIRFSVKFSRSHTVTQLNGHDYLLGVDPVNQAPMGIAVLKPQQTVVDDCRAVGTITVIKQITVEGEDHNLCGSTAASVYTMNFRNNDIWYAFVMGPKDTNQPKIDLGTVTKVAQSINIHG